MRDESGVLSKAYFVTGHVLRIFRKHIDVFRAEVRRMVEEWERAYPPVDFPDRNDYKISLRNRKILGENWSKVTDHASKIHHNLVSRIENRIIELESLRKMVS